MSKKSIHFIINPISGTGKQLEIEKKISKYIDSSQFEPKIHYTKYRGHAIEIARDLVAKNAHLIIAVGGDGTVNEIAQTMVNSSSVLGIIPTGSGNGLARHLKIPQNVSRALELLNTQKSKEIDSCTANNEFFMNVSGVGYDAHIAHCFAKEPKRGLQTYLKLILSKWWSYSFESYQITSNGLVVFDGQAAQISFANTAQFGNNVVISPNSVIDDGEIELCIVKPFRFYEVPFLLVALAARSLHRSNKMELIKCSSAIITCSNTKVHLDGEPREFEQTIDLKVLPKSIRIISA